MDNVRVSVEDNNGTAKVIDQTDYYPFGLEHNLTTANNYKYSFQGQERQDEYGLTWSSFKWRNEDVEIGRFFNHDPLSEKYYYNALYAFAENKAIDHIELEGLEGLHHIFTDQQGNKNNQLEKNVVILTQKKVEPQIGMSEKQIIKIERQNGRIDRWNNARVSRITGELKSYYKTDGGSFKNSEGENVTFKINISAKDVEDTSGNSG